MKRITKIIGSSVLAVILAGGTGASAAELSRQAMLTDSGSWMTELSTYAGTGDLDDRDGPLLDAAFRLPEGIAVSKTGEVWVSDSRNQTIRKLSDGQVSVFAGVNLLLDPKGFPVGGLIDGNTDRCFFQRPAGIAIGEDGSLYIADSGNHAVRKIDTKGYVSTLAGDGVLGSKDGAGSGARFYKPKDVAVTKDGTVYVADTLNHLIRRIASDGTVSTLNAPSARVVEVFPGKAVPAGDYADGELLTAKFNEPSGLALDKSGNLYVSDTGNHRIRYIDFAAGQVTTVAGGGTAYAGGELYAEGGYTDGAALDARFHFPSGIAVTAEGGLLIADSMNHSVRYLKDGAVRTITGQEKRHPGETDGIEGTGELHSPTDVAELPDGHILVSDSFNNKIRMISLWSLPEDVMEDGSVHVVLNGRTLSFDAPPEISPEGRTMVPVRAIAEAVGYDVKFTEEGQLVGLTNGSYTVEMAVGQTTVNRILAGKAPLPAQKVDAAPYIKQDRTYVPLRFFAENLEMDVQWDAGTRTAILRTKSAKTR